MIVQENVEKVNIVSFKYILLNLIILWIYFTFNLGQNPDYQSEDPLATASGYRAVAPDLKSGLDAAERRKQMIQESKFLGGDMAHTHLVKGLDYALLQKVRNLSLYVIEKILLIIL